MAEGDVVQVGNVMKVKTKTFGDTYGDCIWEVIEIGLPAPEKERREAGEMDGVKARYVAGSGPAGVVGHVVQDSQFKIKREIKSGVTQIITGETADRLVASYANTAAKPHYRGEND